MQTQESSKLVFVALVAFTHSGCGGPPQPTETTTNHRNGPDLLTCADRHGFRHSGSGSPQPVTGDCQPNGCGLNGVWLGRELAFRTLNLPVGAFPSTPNEAGISIVAFRDKHNKELKLDVQGQQLFGSPGGKVDEVVGAHLLLEKTMDTSGTPRTYDLTIESVDTTTPFWAGCIPSGNDSDECQMAPAAVNTYTFTAMASDGCQVAVCSPEMTGDYNELTGSAVIFRGDHYTDTYDVSKESGPMFNIACVRSDLYKLHMLRHTSAARSPGHDSGFPQRQALLRMLTADYCGIGHPFTKNDTAIRFQLRDPVYSPTAASHYVIGGTDTQEALWTPDGALCISSPRSGVGLDEIQNVCKNARSCVRSDTLASSPAMIESALPQNP
jgi:hypothetical protein